MAMNARLKAALLPEYRQGDLRDFVQCFSN